MSQPKIIWEGITPHGHYQVVDGVYDGRPARVLYSGDRQAAQSGVATDDRSELLFDYIQRFYELATAQQPKNVLVVGGGAGTLATAVLNALPEVTVDVVEPNAVLVDLGYRFFGLPALDRLHVFYTDGRTFLQQHRTRYDLIAVDAFNHTTMPGELATVEAMHAYVSHLRPNGALAMNVISGYYGSGARVLAQVGEASRAVFATTDVFLARRGYTLWLPQNYVVVARRRVSKFVPGQYLRTDWIKLPA